MRIYNDVNDIDAFTGGLSETLNKGSLLGPTFGGIFFYIAFGKCLLLFFQNFLFIWLKVIVAKQFQDLKESDRFYFENGNDVRTRFTGVQMEEIKKINIASIMCNNLDLNIIQSRAFLGLNRQNARISCWNTPLIDLTKWRNEVVWIKFYQTDNKQ